MASDLKRTLELSSRVRDFTTAQIASMQETLDSNKQLKIDHAAERWGSILDYFFWHLQTRKPIDHVPRAAISFDFLRRQSSGNLDLANLEFMRFLNELSDAGLISYRSEENIVLTDLGRLVLMSRNWKSRFREVVEIARDNTTLAWIMAFAGFVAAVFALRDEIYKHL